MVLTGNVAAPSRALKEEIGEGEMLDKSTDDWKQCCQRRRLVGGYTKRCPCHENSVAYFSKTRPTIFTKLGTMLEKDTNVRSIGLVFQLICYESPYRPPTFPMPLEPGLLFGVHSVDCYFKTCFRDITKVGKMIKKSINLNSIKGN
jgi:hypothetical protein